MNGLQPEPMISTEHEALQESASSSETGATSLRIIDAAEEMEQLRPLWMRHESHPNNDLDYFLLIARGRQEVVSPLVIAIQRNGNLICSLAGRIENTRQRFQLGYLSCGSVPVRKLPFVTSGALGPFSPDEAGETIEALRSTLKSHALHFAVIHNQPLDSALAREAVASVPFLLREHGARDRVHWRMSLPATFDEFLARRKKKHRYWLNRLPRVLEKAFPGKVVTKVFETSDEVPGFCRDADAVAALTYQRKLGAGFSNVGETREYCELLGARKALKGYILYVDEKPCAYWLASTHRDILFLHATGYDPAFRKFEVGTILFLNLIRDACGSGLEKVDFGLGTADYKERFGDENWLEKDFYIFAPTLRGVLLNVIISGGMYAENVARWLVSQAGPVGKIKRMWRRRLAKTETPAEAESE